MRLHVRASLPLPGPELVTSMSSPPTPHQAGMAADCKRSGSNEAPSCHSPASFQQMLDLSLWRHASPASVISFQLGRKNITPQSSPVSFQGRMGISTTYPLSDLSFALLVFQGEKISPKTLIPGDMKRKLIFTIKFFYR